MLSREGLLALPSTAYWWVQCNDWLLFSLDCILAWTVCSILSPTILNLKNMVNVIYNGHLQSFTTIRRFWVPSIIYLFFLIYYLLFLKDFQIT
jgi:hypothetical protein